MNDLANAHRMTLWGAPADARFPALCPACGGAATQRLPIARSFRRSSASDSASVTVVLSCAVPFCDACMARHRAEAVAPSLVSTVLSAFTSGDMFAAVGFGAAACFTGYHALIELFRGRGSHFAVFAALTAVFAWISRFEARQAWRDTEFARIPAPTSVTRAFDHGDNEPPPFESPRYTCSMRDAGFFAAFQALNSDIEFRADSPRAHADRRQGNRQAWIIGAVVAAIALFFAARDLLR